ncbi:uncharacterized protein LOC144866149 isoform X2 [Branchiostoma floridae x Branchiostoma japonicum]
MDSSSVLLVSDQYVTSKENSESINRQVGQTLTGAGRKVYSTVLEDTEEDRKCAEADGVELILPTCIKGDTRKPCMEWLTFDHRTRYSSLPQDVGWIVGHAGVTSKAAATIKEECFPKASLSLVTQTIPEDTEKFKEEEKAMGIGEKEDSIRQDAEKADTVFSVGHRTHDHFTNTFCAIPKDKRPTHYLFLPEPSELFQKTTVEYRETKEKVVLLISRVNTVEKVKGFDLATKVLSKVVEMSHDRIKLRIRGVTEEEYQASMDILQASINSGKLIPTLLPQGTQEDICRDMQQAHLVLMPSRTEPFGLIGLEAMAAGVPVLISDQSGLATLVNQVIPEFHHSVLRITGNDSIDVRQWADQIGKVLEMSKAEHSRAAALKQRLLKSRYWEESHQQLLQAFGGTGNDTKQPTTAPVQKRKRVKALMPNDDRSGKYPKPDATEMQQADRMSEAHRTLLLRNYLVISLDLDVTRVLDYLHQHGVLTDGMRQDILAIPEDQRHHRARKLLTWILNGGDSAFTIFRTALDQVGYRHLMELLTEDHQEPMPPMPMALAIYPGFQSNRPSASHTFSDVEQPQLAVQNQTLLTTVKQELAKESFTVQEKKQILQLKTEMRDEELKALYMYQENVVKSLERAKTFLSEEILVTRFDELLAKVEEKQATIVNTYRDCVILFLTYSSQANFDNFWGSYTSQSLSDTLSELLITEELRRLDGGDQLVVRTLVLEDDCRAWMDFFEKDEQQTTEAPDDTYMQKLISELASVELEQQMGRQRRPRERSSVAGSSGTSESGCSGTYTPTDGQDTQVMKNLFAKLNTPAVKEDKAQKCDLYCEIGDLYRTKLHILPSALQYYQNMLECSQELSENTKQAKAYSRLGLTCDMLGLQQEAYRNHERALAIYGVETRNETDICVAYKNLASSLALSGQVSDANTNYESALAVAIETGNKTEQMDIYCMLGDLHRKQLHDEPQVSHKYYTEMLALAKDLGRKDKERQAYNRLGVVCEDMQDNESALEWHQKYLKSSQEDGAENEQITAHTNIAASHKALGKLDLARSHYQSAMYIAMETGNKTKLMDIDCKLGDLHRKKLHEPQVSYTYYTEMLAHARDLGRKDMEEMAYNRLELACGDMQHNEAALEWSQKYLKMKQDSGDKTSQSTAHKNIADSYKELGKLDLARSHYQSAMDIAMETGNKTEEMDIYCKMGDLHREQLHEQQVSHIYYTAMLALARDLGRKDMEKLAYNRLGVTHYDMGKYEAALKWSQKSLKMKQESGDRTEEMSEHRNLAASYKALGKLHLARSHYQSAMTIAMEIGDITEQMDIYCELGDLLRKQINKPQASNEYYTEMLVLASDLGRKDKERLAYNKLGVVHYDIGNYEEGLQWSQKFLEMSLENDDKAGQITAHKNIAASFKALGKLDLARSHYQSALTVAMETGDKQQQENIAENLANL